MVQPVLQACLLAWAEVAIVMAEALAELSRAELRAFHAPGFALCELSLLDPVRDKSGLGACASATQRDEQARPN